MNEVQGGIQESRCLSGLPYLAHGCITIRRCVAYIHDPDTTLNFDLKVKFICLCVRAITFSWFDIGLPHLAHRSITMRRCDTSIHVPDSMLTFDLNVKCIGFMTFLCVQASALMSYVRNTMSYDIVIYFVWLEYITMVRCIVYIHELCMTLTSNLNIKIIFSPWI